MAIKSKAGFGFVRASCLTVVTVLALLRPALAVETNAAPGADNAAASAMDARDFLRSYLQLQEQLRDTQLAIEKIRQESAAASASNAAAMDERWRLMESAAASERVEQISGMAHLNRTILIAAGGFACIGFMVLLLAAFLQWTAVNRLAAVSASLSGAHSLRGSGAVEALLPPAHHLEESNLRFLDLLGRLEQRLRDMEASVKPPHSLPESSSTNGFAPESSPQEVSPPPAPDKTSAINVLLSKSQTLLKLDKTEAALACLDEVLTLDPAHADAWAKKGVALERVQRTQEAIECYDRAIAQDASLTTTYLYKAGLLNRMERHSEALACYEQALKPGKTAKPRTPPSNKPNPDLAAAPRHS